jgi:cyclophilin family peptidyl-prolyl cis-trans isomerase
MKQSSKPRRVVLSNWDVEKLETRCLLSATVEAQIGTQNVSTLQGPDTIALGSFLNDPQLTGGTVVEMQTPVGNMFLQLTNSQTPLTVANFIQYISDGEYTPTIIQRSAPGFVLQGGGTKPDGSNNIPVSTLQSEAGLSNVTGTIAMALSDGPNSGTNQWFINLGDNSSVLDGTSDGGPFTVFGNVIDGTLSVANTISELPIIDGSQENPNWYIGPDDGLPVINYSGSADPSSVPEANLVTDNIVQLTSSQAQPTYTASSSDPSVVGTSVNGGNLTLTALGAGSATVTVTITDLGGEQAQEMFTVNSSFTSVNNGVLTVEGTPANDTITLAGTTNGITATLNGSTSQAYTDITGVEVLGIGGADSITMPGLPVPATVYGGGGADTIAGGAGNDLLDGGKGADLVGGAGGDDTVIGGPGDDTIKGGAGNDSLLTGAGTDVAHGGVGDDTIVAGSGLDTINGNAGNDSIIAGSGGGQLFAGPGSDNIVGSTTAGDQNDSIYCGSDSDTILAGSGDQIFFSQAGDSIVGGTIEP